MSRAIRKRHAELKYRVRFSTGSRNVTYVSAHVSNGGPSGKNLHFIGKRARTILNLLSYSKPKIEMWPFLRMRLKCHRNWSQTWSHQSILEETEIFTQVAPNVVILSIISVLILWWIKMHSFVDLRHFWLSVIALLFNACRDIEMSKVTQK